MLLLAKGRYKIDPGYSLRQLRRKVARMIWKRLLQAFLLPGNVVCDLVGASAEDDRSMIRTLINMLVWNAVIVLAVVLW